MENVHKCVYVLIQLMYEVVRKYVSMYVCLYVQTYEVKLLSNSTKECAVLFANGKVKYDELNVTNVSNAS